MNSMPFRQLKSFFKILIGVQYQSPFHVIGIEYSAKIPKTINWLHSIGKFLLFAQNHGNAAKTRKIS